MSDGIFDERVAPFYDATSAEMFDESVLGPTLGFLRNLSGDQPALEFASGTGRVALALREAGTDVQGVELSRPMVEQMRAKPGAEDVPVTIGDMATTRVGGTFGLVYLVFNTIGNLLSQDEQVRCFQNASDHLGPGGSFVIEMTVPDLCRLPPGERFVLFEKTAGHVGIDEYDLADQQLVSHHVWTNGPRLGEFQTPQRYVWPAELDLMARMAGLRLIQRWATWNRQPFTSDSRAHISVWEKG